MNDSLVLTPAAQVVIGLLLLLLGRRIFWLFVAAVGFFLGAEVAQRMFTGLADGIVLLISLVTGLAGAALAVVLQRLAVTLAGGIAGGLMAVRIAPLFGVFTDAGVTVAFVAGFLLAALLLTVLFDPALIVMSALTGAVMVAEAFPIDPVVEPLVLIPLVVAGIIVQARGLKRRVA